MQDKFSYFYCSKCNDSVDAYGIGEYNKDTDKTIRIFKCLKCDSPVERRNLLKDFLDLKGKVTYINDELYK